MLLGIFSDPPALRRLGKTAGFPEQAFRQKLCEVRCALICSPTGLSSSSSDLVPQCFCLKLGYNRCRQPESILPTIMSDQPLYTSQFVCFRSVVRASERKFEKKQTHTHMLELPVIFHIKTKTLEHVAKNWHSSKGNSNQNQGYTHPKNVAMQM